MLGNCKSFKKERNWISQVEIAKYLMVNVIRDGHKLSICSTQLPKKNLFTNHSISAPFSTQFYSQILEETQQM